MKKNSDDKRFLYGFFLGFIMVIAMVLASSCSNLTPAPEVKDPAEVVTPAPVVVDPVPAVGEWGTIVIPPTPAKWKWNTELVAAIKLHGADLLAAEPEDAELWCPGYKNKTREQRASMWVALLVRLAFYESRYNPNTTFTEPNVYDANGNAVSTGLFQMSRESSTNYFCGITAGSQLKDPKRNIVCTIKAFNILVPAGNKYKSPAKSSTRIRSFIGGNYIPYTDSKGKRRNSWQGGGAYWSQFRKPAELASMRAVAKAACQ